MTKRTGDRVGQTLGARAVGKKRRVHILDTGLWTGNIGDDAMCLGAASQIPSDLELACEVHSLERATRFGKGRAIHWQDLEAVRASIFSSDAAVLLTDTPIMEDWGLEWPLRSNAPKLEWCHQAGVPVHAAGIGVDLLRKPEALQIFHSSFLPVASWTVRSEQCRRNLVLMGVSPESISVGADWAWIAPIGVNADYANSWASTNRGSDGPRVGINLVGEMWAGDVERKRSWAKLLDELSDQLSCQLFFLCNESRNGDFYDFAMSREVIGLMRKPATLVPNLYYQPSEVISMLSTLDLTISLRYHFTVFSLLAGTPCLSLSRGQKMASLNAELGLPFVGDADRPDPEQIMGEARKAFSDRQDYLRRSQDALTGLKTRASRNLSSFLSSLYANRC